MLTPEELASIQQRDLYWCMPNPTDTVGSEQSRDRIWTVVSTSRAHRGNCVVGIPLSTQTHKAQGHLILVPKSEFNPENGYVPTDCVALTDQIRALDKTRFRKRAGVLSVRSFSAILLGLDRVLGR